MAGNIQHLADKIQTGILLGFHCLGADAASVNASKRYLRGSIAFCTGRFDAPVIKIVADFIKFFIAEPGKRVIFKFVPPQGLKLID